MILLECWLCRGAGMIPVGLVNSAETEDQVCPVCRGEGWDETRPDLPPDDDEVVPLDPRGTEVIGTAVLYVEFPQHDDQ